MIVSSIIYTARKSDWKDSVAKHNSIGCIMKWLGKFTPIRITYALHVQYKRNKYLNTRDIIQQLTSFSFRNFPYSSAIPRSDLDDKDDINVLICFNDQNVNRFSCNQLRNLQATVVGVLVVMLLGRVNLKEIIINAIIIWNWFVRLLRTVPYRPIDWRRRCIVSSSFHRTRIYFR